MPTVMLTTTCQNSCPWCFARAKMEYYRSQGIEEMSWEDFLTLVRFYEGSNYRQMNLLGGEPTLHSRVIDILKHLTSRGFFTLVVTNGLLPATLVDTLPQEQFPNVQYFVNSTSYFDHEPEKRRMMDYFLLRTPHAITLSYTITERDVMQPGLEPILDRLFLIMRFGLRPHLQFQIAVPSHGNGDFVPFDRYGTVVELLRRWIDLLQKNRVSVGLDCHCIPACSIPTDARFPFPLNSSCRDFMIDIGPNLEVWPCFPLSSETFKLKQFGTLSELRSFFARASAADQLLRDNDCTACEREKNTACDAGCRGFQILRRTARSGDNRKSVPGRGQRNAVA